MNLGGVINLSQAAAKRVDAVVAAVERLAAAIEVANEQRDAELNGPRG